MFQVQSYWRMLLFDFARNTCTAAIVKYRNQSLNSTHKTVCNVQFIRTFGWLNFKITDLFSHLCKLTSCWRYANWFLCSLNSVQSVCRVLFTQNFLLQPSTMSQIIHTMKHHKNESVTEGYEIQRIYSIYRCVNLTSANHGSVEKLILWTS
jgi:hypothetical protein